MTKLPNSLRKTSRKTFQTTSVSTGALPFTLGLTLALTALGCGVRAAPPALSNEGGSEAAPSLSRAAAAAAALANLSALNAAPDGQVYARFERNELLSGKFADILAALNARTQSAFAEADFRKSDEHELLTSHYVRYAQQKKGADIDGASVRIWLDHETQNPILVEAYLTTDKPWQTESADTPNTNFSDALDVVKKEMAFAAANGDILSISTKNIFATVKGSKTFVRRIELRTKEGRYFFDFANRSAQIVNRRFRAALTSEAHGSAPQTLGSAPSQRVQASQFSLPANAYPLWELPTVDTPPISNSDTPLNPPPPSSYGNVAAPSRVELSRLLSRVPGMNFGSYLSSQSLSFLWSKRKQGALSADELSKGYWNDELTRFLFPAPWENHARMLPNVIGFDAPVRLYGSNVVVMLHHDVQKLFSDKPVVFKNAPQFVPDYTDFGEDDTKIIYRPAKWGKAVRGQNDLLARSPYSADGKPHPEDSAALVQAGFDEAQVYYGTDVFLDTLQSLGFADKELSTRPFTAILFDPSVDMRNNAYYDNNTINFTTYTKGEMNYARDNSTIWHELGHGIQDRVMGPHIDSSEGYGLWEGIADFVAQIIIDQKFGLEPFAERNSLRILNAMHFYLTNESHDEGEAYGGAMNTMLEAAIGKYGNTEGLLRMTDLALETMRLTRDHPRLTAEVWFEQMKYVDTLPRKSLVQNREPGQLRELIDSSLSVRNYNPGKKPARFVVERNGEELTDRSEGSRNNPIKLDVSAGTLQKFELQMKLTNGEISEFKFPATVRIGYRGGPLQGALKWTGEENKFTDVVVASPNVPFTVPVEVDASTCDYSNRSDGGCSDFVYLQVFNAGEEKAGKPIGKKRFYLRKVGK